MKKIMLSGLLMVISLVNYAQNNTAKKSTINANNELKINLFNTVAGMPEINYERIIGDDMGIGLAVLVGLDDEIDYTFGVIPHFRVYFGGKKASGFFEDIGKFIEQSKDKV